MVSSLDSWILGRASSSWLQKRHIPLKFLDGQSNINRGNDSPWKHFAIHLCLGNLFSVHLNRPLWKKTFTHRIELPEHCLNQLHYSAGNDRLMPPSQNATHSLVMSHYRYSAFLPAYFLIQYHCKTSYILSTIWLPLLSSTRVFHDSDRFTHEAVAPLQEVLLNEPYALGAGRLYRAKNT